MSMQHVVDLFRHAVLLGIIGCGWLPLDAVLVTIVAELDAFEFAALIRTHASDSSLTPLMLHLEGLEAL